MGEKINNKVLYMGGMAVLIGLIALHFVST